jgi:D-alanine--poly(phosphoribitol) ligase subunit 2
MTPDEIEARIVTFVRQDLLVELDDTVTPDTDLFRAGVIESRDYLKILRFLQSDLGVEMTDEDLFANVLVSLNGMVGFVLAKQGVGAAGGAARRPFAGDRPS